MWTYYVLREHKPQVLEDLPGADSNTGARVATETSNGAANGVNGDNDVMTNGNDESSSDSNGNNSEQTSVSAPPQEVRLD